MLKQYNEYTFLKRINLSKKYPHDAGWDIRTPTDLEILPGQSIVVKTGLHICVPKGMKGIIQSRSGNAINNCIEASNAGVIDYGFTGECQVKLYNFMPPGHDDRTWDERIAHFEVGDRIAQIVFDESHTIRGIDWIKLKWNLFWKGLPQVVPEIPMRIWANTERGDGGLGSTGVK